MEDDEFHYHENLPMKGRLLWNMYLSTDDVKYLFTSVGVEWAKNLDMNKYADEYDGTPPRIEFTAADITDEAANVIHLSIAPFGGLADGLVVCRDDHTAEVQNRYSRKCFSCIRKVSGGGRHIGFM